MIYERDRPPLSAIHTAHIETFTAMVWYYCPSVFRSTLLWKRPCFSSTTSHHWTPADLMKFPRISVCICESVVGIFCPKWLFFIVCQTQLCLKWVFLLLGVMQSRPGKSVWQDWRNLCMRVSVSYCVRRCVCMFVFQHVGLLPVTVCDWTH